MAQVASLCNGNFNCTRSIQQTAVATQKAMRAHLAARMDRNLNECTQFAKVDSLNGKFGSLTGKALERRVW